MTNQPRSCRAPSGFCRLVAPMRRRHPREPAGDGARKRRREGSPAHDDDAHLAGLHPRRRDPDPIHLRRRGCLAAAGVVDASQGTKSLALIVDDPDAPDPKAPKMTWVHWVLYNLPPTADGLPDGVPARALPAGTREGLGDWKRSTGAVPPIGLHRYVQSSTPLPLLPYIGWLSKVEL